jgi:hypothetical protein
MMKLSSDPEAFSVLVSTLSPRNPQRQSSTGQTRDEEPEEFTMHIRISRTLLFAFVFALVLLSMPATSFGAIGVVVSFAPPPLPVYEQPICPGDGYLWTPGYWGWGDDFSDYYWVPGTWVLAPEAGFLWTPGYWGWGDGGFAFYDGYWGPQIGFYGGVNYGFGYFGVGFEGGRWENGHFFYNRAVMNVNVTEIHNVYETRINETTINHVSYNGGQGGITVRPTAAEESAAHERHVGPVAEQTHHAEQAHSDPQQRASTNHGKPAVAATPRAGDFKSGAVAAREAGGSYTPPANRGGNAARGQSNAGGTNAAHVRELPPAEKPAAPNTGNAKMDKKYQQQQEKLYAQQSKERDKVTKQQEKEDQKAAKQSEPARQQVEQRHQQQTQQLQQKHQQQTQQMQTRIQASPRGGKH